VTLLFRIFSFCPSLQCRSGWWRHGRPIWWKLRANKNSTWEKSKSKLYAHWFFHLIRKSTRLKRPGEYFKKQIRDCGYFRPGRVIRLSMGLLETLMTHLLVRPLLLPVSWRHLENWRVCLHFVEPFTWETVSLNGTVAAESRHPRTFFIRMWLVFLLRLCNGQNLIGSLVTAACVECRRCLSLWVERDRTGNPSVALLCIAVACCTSGCYSSKIHTPVPFIRCDPVESCAT